MNSFAVSELARQHKVSALDDLPIDGQICRTIDGFPVLICRTNDNVFAMENRCSHVAQPLEGGKMNGKVIKCPSHGAKFDMQSGEPVGSSRLSAIKTFPIEIIDNQILITLPIS